LAFVIFRHCAYFCVIFIDFDQPRISLDSDSDEKKKNRKREGDPDSIKAKILSWLARLKELVNGIDRQNKYDLIEQENAFGKKEKVRTQVGQYTDTEKADLLADVEKYKAALERLGPEDFFGVFQPRKRKDLSEVVFIPCSIAALEFLQLVRTNHITAKYKPSWFLAPKKYIRQKKKGQQKDAESDEDETELTDTANAAASSAGTGNQSATPVRGKRNNKGDKKKSPKHKKKNNKKGNSPRGNDEDNRSNKKKKIN
jgi:hypothetical protein